MKPRNLITKLICTAALAFMLCGHAQAWWNAEWTVRKKITIDTSDKGAGINDSVGTSPVLIRLHDGDFQFAGAKDDGSDIRFVDADDKTLLTYHIEKYDTTMDEAFVWVKVPNLKPGGQATIWLYYGNPKADSVVNTKNTYDTDTVLVYHFAEHGAPAVDSTSQANNAKNAGTSVEASMIGDGLRLDGRRPVTVPASPSLEWSGGDAITWSAWINAGSLQPDAVLFSRRDGAKSFLIGVDNGVPYVSVGGQKSGGKGPIAVNSWHHLAVVADASKITLYLDGELYATLGASVPPMNSPLVIGGDATVTGDAPAAITEGTAGFNGQIDEVEISKVARPAGYIKLAAIGQGADGATKLITSGTDEQMTNWLSALGSGTMGVLIRSLTPDGWAVIAILSVMAVVSWSVMFSKASYLNKIKKGNEQFMKQWSHVAADLTILDQGESDTIQSMGGRVDPKGQRAIKQASVYRIYHIGAEEIRHRFSGNSTEPKVLSSQSIQAIRAALDGGLVRETQKLNNMMVLLTIAISGGPFLGLLGTVVGVMITFAAIAAAGDVNVNAIAPGIAAALLATVAGLAVAIPSLFGYNYLTIQIKNAVSDMHVFADEFVTKMAEFYRPRSD